MASAPLYIFDIDGTLTDSIPTYLKVITQILKDIGLKDIDTDYDNYIHHTDLYALEYNYERNFGKKPPSNLGYSVCLWHRRFTKSNSRKDESNSNAFYRRGSCHFC